MTGVEIRAEGVVTSKSDRPDKSGQVQYRAQVSVLGGKLDFTLSADQYVTFPAVGQPVVVAIAAREECVSLYGFARLVWVPGHLTAFSAPKAQRASA